MVLSEYPIRFYSIITKLVKEGRRSRNITFSTVLPDNVRYNVVLKGSVLITSEDMSKAVFAIFIFKAILAFEGDNVAVINFETI